MEGDREEGRRVLEENSCSALFIERGKAADLNRLKRVCILQASDIAGINACSLSLRQNKTFKSSSDGYKNYT